MLSKVEWRKDSTLFNEKVHIPCQFDDEQQTNRLIRLLIDAIIDLMGFIVWRTALLDKALSDTPCGQQLTNHVIQLWW